MRSFLGAVLLVFQSSVALAGDPICPLPEVDQQKAVKAFEKMAVMFKDPRCANCHGALNPYTGKGHAGGDISYKQSFSTYLEDRKALVAAMTKADGAPPTDKALSDAIAAPPAIPWAASAPSGCPGPSACSPT